MTGNGVLFVGSIMVDVIAPVPRLPLSGQGVVAEGVVSRLGGCAFNSANIARQLAGTRKAGEGDAAPEVRLFAPVGKGPFGSFMEDELAARGMDVFAPDAGVDSGAAVCLIEPDGERTMLTLPGIECCFEPAWFAALDRRLDVSAFGSGNLCGYEVGSTGGEAMIAFFETHPDLQLWFAPGPMLKTIDPTRIARINALAPIWHLNEAEALSFTGEADIPAAGRAICGRTGNATAITAGKDGCYVCFPDGQVLHVPTTPVRPVDTIGAGDSHLGALMVARAAGYTWEEACVLANRVSGVVCGIEGATLSDAQFADTGLAL
ncbi:MAG: sugar kinase [Eggerthellaceae bacterium]|nr:sugar kinase [Eggerthellaceae bacterium]